MTAHLRASIPPQVIAGIAALLNSNLLQSTRQMSALDNFFSGRRIYGIHRFHGEGEAGTTYSAGQVDKATNSGKIEPGKVSLEIYGSRMPAMGNRTSRIMGNKRNINSFHVQNQEWECTKGICNIPRERLQLQKTVKRREKIPAPFFHVTQLQHAGTGSCSLIEYPYLPALMQRRARKVAHLYSPTER